MLVQCCVCKKVKSNASWDKAPESDTSAHMSHSYCPACLADAERAIRAERTSALIAAQLSLSAASL